VGRSDLAEQPRRPTHWTAGVPDSCLRGRLRCAGSRTRCRGCHVQQALAWGRAGWRWITCNRHQQKMTLLEEVIALRGLRASSSAISTLYSLCWSLLSSCTSARRPLTNHMTMWLRSDARTTLTVFLLPLFAHLCCGRSSILQICVDP